VLLTSSSQVSWIISVQTFVTFAASCFTGSLFDKYGHRPLIATGTFLLVLGFCMLSLCKEYYQLMLVHATMLPLGCNLLYVLILQR
jgi:MFS family permease